jgi:Zn-dependent peptidase ImmA (M78 family)
VTIAAPFLPYDKLREVAAEFLRRYHPTGTIPVPIAAIVEFDFRMEVIPVPGLLQSYQIDSSISNDLATIYVDEFVFKKRPTRYRFSLAHELSHKLIHAEIFQQVSFRTFAEWKDAMNSISIREYGWIESQAYSLAGLMLVPPNALAASYRTAQESGAAAGISLQEMDAGAAKIVAAAIGREFEVSGEVIRKRLGFDGICQWPRTGPS